jgi:hypothetical protein
MALILALVQKSTDSEPGIRMVEDLREYRPLPGQGRAPGQALLVVLEFAEHVKRT